ncbi:DUF493 family protein [Flavobacteriaceae bacterium Ap0902]|nr:DUF493 family protein [Flavobacteriaceae bacterium Ap0902]
MSENKKEQERTQEEFYARLKNELNKVESFPSNFTYKFIVPTDNKKIAEIQSIFDNTNPQFSTKESSKGKYTSITVVVYVLDAAQVVHYYKQVGALEGVIML